MTILSDIRDAIVDATITDTKTGEELTDVSECYVALSQADAGTLPEHITVEWGPSKTNRRRAIRMAPDWVWDAAIRGDLRLHDGEVTSVERLQHIEIYGAWTMMPRDAGQIVERHYGCDDDYVYRRITDRSDGSVRYERADISDIDMDDYDPANGSLPGGLDWESV